MDDEVKNYQEKHNDLFKKWQEKHRNDANENNISCYVKKYLKDKGNDNITLGSYRNVFIKDGAVNPEEYFNSDNKPRILIIQKEANLSAPNALENVIKEGSHDGLAYIQRNINNYTDIDIPKLSQEEKKELKQVKIFLTKVARAAHCLRECYEYKEQKTYKSARSQDVLNKIAFMNINKRGGMNDADNKAIKEYFDKYNGEIIDEIKFLNPDFIVIIDMESVKEDIIDKINCPNKILYKHLSRICYTEFEKECEYVIKKQNI